MIAYRDYPEAYDPRNADPPPKQFEMLPWTSDAEEVSTFMSSIKAKGGGDWPEDVSGALLEVCSMHVYAQLEFHVCGR